jgi:GNAT superfamily N-acetyltransferase
MNRGSGGAATAGTGEKNMGTSLATKPRTDGSTVLRFRYLGSHEIEELAELWGTLHERHTEGSPHLEGVISTVTPDESWRRRRSQYLAWLGDPDTMAVLAERDDEPVGYAMVTFRGHVQGSWDRGERVAVVQSLAVHPDHNGTGVGAGLLEEVRRQLGSTGVRDIELTALAGDTEDLRFFQQEGFQPFVTTMVCRIGAVGAHD